MFFFLYFINCPNFYYFLGYFYYYGDCFRIDTRKDINDPHKELKKAKEAFEKAAQSGNADAHLILGDIYYYGQIGKPELYKAKEHYEKASEKGNTDAFIRLSDLYFKEKNYSMGKKQLKLAAEKNNSKALILLGNLYHEGKYVKQNYSKSLFYFEKSAFLHNSDALYLIGNLYFYGEGVEKNYSKAKGYYKMAADLHNNSALLCLGNIYVNGYGVEIDIAKSIKYYTLCFQIHNENIVSFKVDIDSLISCTLSFNNLGLIYATENDFRNDDLADHFFFKSVYNEFPFALNNFGLFRELVLNWDGDINHYY